MVDGDGKPLSIGEVQSYCREVFAPYIQDAALLTIYNWRRLGPTVGHLARSTELELVILGSWQEAVQTARMPVRYSGSKEAVTEVPCLLLGAADTCLSGVGSNPTERGQGYGRYRRRRS